MSAKPQAELKAELKELNLIYPLEEYESLAGEAARGNWTQVEYLGRLIEGECQRRRGKRIERRIQAAHFPVVRTLEGFNWGWPKKVNRAQVQNLFRLQFMEGKGNVIFMGGVGLGKTHLATALGYAACQEGHHVLFTTAVDMINTLSAAQAAQRLKGELRKYLAPELLILDELGYLPIDKHGADLLFQVISARYECGSIILTTNKAYKQWSGIFNNDSTLASAVLDRLLHHAETVIMEGSSYRMQERAGD